VKFFLPDHKDTVDPTFDFSSERRSDREGTRHYRYAHEVFGGSAACDGVLVSKAAFDGTETKSAKYSPGERNRLLVEGVRRFFRLDGPESQTSLLTMGDCGAFSAKDEETPAYPVEEVIDFYERCGFDVGASVDLLIGKIDPSLDEVYELALVGGSSSNGYQESDRVRRRQEATHELALEFFSKSHGVCRFAPMGVAQGWSARSYAHSVETLQKIGYTRIAVGGLAVVRYQRVLPIIEAVGRVRRPGTEFHLFGVLPFRDFDRFVSAGVTSFDSTSGLRQAWTDKRNNYHTAHGAYLAVRVPQTSETKMKNLAAQGRVEMKRALALEERALRTLAAYDRGTVTAEDALEAVLEYEELHEPGSSSAELYERTLRDRPWTRCRCSICRDLGIHVIIFRGAERNRRRGFHNVFVMREKLAERLSSVRTAA
jgi:hypothetical protein